VEDVSIPPYLFIASNLFGATTAKIDLTILTSSAMHKCAFCAFIFACSVMNLAIKPPIQIETKCKRKSAVSYVLRLRGGMGVFGITHPQFSEMYNSSSAQCNCLAGCRCAHCNERTGYKNILKGSYPRPKNLASYGRGPDPVPIGDLTQKFEVAVALIWIGHRFLKSVFNVADIGNSDNLTLITVGLCAKGKLSSFASHSLCALTSTAL
jgi:hypothetical protein